MLSEFCFQLIGRIGLVLTLINQLACTIFKMSEFYESVNLIDKPDLDVKDSCRLPGNPACPQPIGRQTIWCTDLIGPHAV